MSEVKFGSFADTQMWSDNELKYLKHVEQRWPDELTPTMIALIDAELKRREKRNAGQA